MARETTIDYDARLFENSEILRRRLPEELDELLEAELRLIKANLMAQRWEAAHQAIDRLAAEAVQCRPWKLPLDERRQLRPAQIGLTVRVANAVESAGFSNVGQLLVARYGQIMASPSFGPGSLEEVRDALRSLFRHEIKGSAHPELRDLLWDWPAGQPEEAA